MNRRQSPPAEGLLEDRPSKSQRKREMTALQDLGERLLAMPPAKLRTMPVPPELVEAIELAQRIHAREGLRRQRQYIGRLMRDVDPEPLRAALDEDGAGQRAEVALMHQAERWRERLLGDPSAVAEFSARHPGAGARIEPLLERARGELAQGRPGRGYRELFRALRDTLAAPPAGDGPARP